MRRLLIITVRLALWATINLLVALGLATSLFILFANACFSGFFIEARNLASHYLAAVTSAQAQFQHVTLGLGVLVWLLVCLMRIDSLVAVLRIIGLSPVPSTIPGDAHAHA
jgi:hypothetical protein